MPRESQKIRNALPETLGIYVSEWLVNAFSFWENYRKPVFSNLPGEFQVEPDSWLYDSDDEYHQALMC